MNKHLGKDLNCFILLCLFYLYKARAGNWISSVVLISPYSILSLLYYTHVSYKFKSEEEIKLLILILILKFRIISNVPDDQLQSVTTVAVRQTRVSDPHPFHADPDQDPDLRGLKTNADPDTHPDPDPDAIDKIEQSSRIGRTSMLTANIRHDIRAQWLRYSIGPVWVGQAWNWQHETVLVLCMEGRGEDHPAASWTE